MDSDTRGLVIGGHDDHFLIIDSVGTDYVVGVRSHTGDVMSVYLMNSDIEKIVEFLCRANDGTEYRRDTS
jgi:hypothetical protein